MLATLSGVNQIGDKVLLHVVDPNSDRAFFVDKAFKGDFHELAAAQQADQDELLACQTAITGLKLREIPLSGRSCRGNPLLSCVTSLSPG
jgi:hypothetical protein